MSPAERRRSSRIRLQVPLFIRGVDPAGAEFVDLAKTLDISATGALLASVRLLGEGNTVSLTFPAPPTSSSCGAVPPETPPIQARVRRQEAAGDVRLAAVEFLKTLN